MSKIMKKKNPAAVALGILSVKKRKNKPDYVSMGKRSAEVRKLNKQHENN